MIEQFTNFCKRNMITKGFSSVAHPQVNNRVKAMNNIIKNTLKKILQKTKGKWVDELLVVLWFYKTFARISIWQTSSSLSYGYETILPVKVDMPPAYAHNLKSRAKWSAYEIVLRFFRGEKRRSYAEDRVVQIESG